MNYTYELLSETAKLSNTEYRPISQVDNSPYQERNINSAPWKKQIKQVWKGFQTKSASKVFQN